MYPPSGPIEGNTLLDINGTDLGRGFNTIESITVAGFACDLMAEEASYTMSER